MTELERQLADGLAKLSKQYEQDMLRLSNQNSDLQRQVLECNRQINNCTSALRVLNEQTLALHAMLRELAES